jgi:hypothetical protein
VRGVNYDDGMEETRGAAAHVHGHVASGGAESGPAPLSDRERFLAMLYTAPVVPADAVVVFTGDGRVRLDAAYTAIMHNRAAPYLVLSGGVDDPPHSLLADLMAKMAVVQGVPPERLIVDNASQNTHEQSVWLAREIRRRGWQAVTLVVSAYHMPRAFLTTVKALADTPCRVMPLTPIARWHGSPDGQLHTRAELLADELRKIEEYGAKGHVASYAEGLAYLGRWER